MEITNFLKLVHSDKWHEGAEVFLDEFIRARYGASGRKIVALRCPKLTSDGGIPFAAVLHKDSPTSGGYGGTSFVIFPADEAPALVALVIGTQGLNPDEQILTRPGHARLCKAFAAWARSELTLASSWAKSDPTRIDIQIPKEVAAKYGHHERTFRRYGNVLYVMFDTAASSDDKVADGFISLLDLYMGERGVDCLTALKPSAQAYRSAYEQRIFPRESEVGVYDLLRSRRFVILQGPPGTGKTRLGLRLLQNQFAGNGMKVQFHPSVGYEQFVGGLAPIEQDGKFGFRPRAGWLMQAAAAAAAKPGKPFLLLIDEINRADLAKVLGEAIFLFEPKEPDREIALAYDFGKPWNSQLNLPQNLHVLGTMNSADRSIAILDLAIRRRFAFSALWPDELALSNSSPLAVEAFQTLRQIFVSQASVEQLELLPGHAYFLANDDKEANRRLRTELVPLLNDYLNQGLIAGFSEDVEGYLQWLDARLL